jgi:hypothetical protein
MNQKIIDKAFQLYYNDWKKSGYKTFAPNMWMFHYALEDKKKNGYLEKAVHLVKIEKIQKIRNKL